VVSKIISRINLFPGIKGVDFIPRNVQKICLVDNLNSWELFLKNIYNYQNTLVSYLVKETCLWFSLLLQIITIHINEQSKPVIHQKESKPVYLRVLFHTSIHLCFLLLMQSK
jgi:hypothetical protein